MARNPIKPIRVYITPPGPNSWKTVFVLEELGLNYELVSFRFDDIKKKPFIDVNPNGRVPAINDPNTDLVLWESGAINQYEKNLLNQWLQFQMSGQGPYYGQCGWFQHLHHEKLPSATERYSKEIKRILGVIERVLTDQDSQWLVGEKMTYADMAFAPWNSRLSEVLVQSWDEVWEGFPRTRAWHERLVDLPSWKRCMKTRARLMDDQGLQWNGVPKGIESFTEYEQKIAAAEDTAAKE